MIHHRVKYDFKTVFLNTICIFHFNWQRVIKYIYTYIFIMCNVIFEYCTHVWWPGQSKQYTPHLRNPVFLCADNIQSSILLVQSCVFEMPNIPRKTEVILAIDFLQNSNDKYWKSTLFPLWYCACVRLCHPRESGSREQGPGHPAPHRCRSSTKCSALPDAHLKEAERKRQVPAGHRGRAARTNRPALCTDKTSHLSAKTF